MRTLIPPDSPLHRLFAGLVEHVFFVDFGVCEPPIVQYLANLLTQFTHVDNIYCLQDARGRPLEEIAEMIADTDLGPETTGQQRTWLIHRHIGDYTLFWTGVYPEGLRRLQMPHRADHFIDFLHQGKRSYAIASDLGDEDSDPPPPLLRRLSEDFELCMHGLGRVRQGWERLSPESYRSARGLWGDAACG